MLFLVLEDDAVKSLLKAGRIVSRVLDYASRYVQPGVKILSICEVLEGLIYEWGGVPAFPCNVSVNYIAAHYTSPVGDTSVIPDGAVVKVDVGAHVDGYIADAARTLSFDHRYDDLVEAVDVALETAISLIRPGVSVKSISKEIEHAIRGFGFKPISNLSGHMLRRYLLHGGKSIPNVGGDYPWIIEEGDVFAIEPFATNGAGYVVEMNESYIYNLVRPRGGRGKLDKRLLKYIISNFKTLPFCERWFKDDFDISDLRKSLAHLCGSGTLHRYPVLREAQNGMVSQMENSVIVVRDGAIVTTSSG